MCVLVFSQAARHALEGLIKATKGIMKNRTSICN